MSIRRLLTLVVLFGAAALPAGAASHFINGKIAFTSTRDGNSEIYLMNPNGTAQTRLTVDKAEDIDPAWSPDATRIAFARDEAICVISADGNHERLLTSKGSSRRPSWSPDGKRIAFTVWSYDAQFWRIQ